LSWRALTPARAASARMDNGFSIRSAMARSASSKAAAAARQHDPAGCRAAGRSRVGIYAVREPNFHNDGYANLAVRDFEQLANSSDPPRHRSLSRRLIFVVSGPDLGGRIHAVSREESDLKQAPNLAGTNGRERYKPSAHGSLPARASSINGRGAKIGGSSRVVARNPSTTGIASPSSSTPTGIDATRNAKPRFRNAVGLTS
jgi:hypothetical protein